VHLKYIFLKTNKTKTKKQTKANKPANKQTNQQQETNIQTYKQTEKIKIRFHTCKKKLANICHFAWKRLLLPISLDLLSYIIKNKILQNWLKFQFLSRHMVFE